MEIKELKLSEALIIIEDRQPLGKFYSFDGAKDIYVGIDTSRGDIRTKKFRSITECMQWLNGKEQQYKIGEEYELIEGKKTKECIIVQECQEYITMRAKDKSYRISIEKYKLANGHIKLILKGGSKKMGIKKNDRDYDKAKELATSTEYTAGKIKKKTGITWGTAQSYIEKYRKKQEEIKKEEVQEDREKTGQNTKELNKERTTVLALKKVLVGKLTGTHYEIKKNGVIIEEGFQNALICRETLGAIIQELEELKMMIN
ncbi:hypothetical protein SAMN05660297_02764 [Natronincola peptidivorans]|uniref:Uncharacterized protein n=1 Tax=Natronincola peptidivorans TaxID=426128 RepID=A0A1I0FEJ2_9FIRM|nr:hypothetical protein [Natronincola peptidivorans]SET55947.1 hypothetical protein SAMN05660297_02764 [Natronincola peptidivorans]